MWELIENSVCLNRTQLDGGMNQLLCFIAVTHIVSYWFFWVGKKNNGNKFAWITLSKWVTLFIKSIDIDTHIYLGKDPERNFLNQLR